jgi:tetratricopeptide (TPR) repeat protein
MTARSSISLIAAALFVIAAGCASEPPRKTPRMDADTLVHEADAELDRGCYLCLRSAADKYEAAIAAGGRSLELAAAGAWTLLAVRERELGLQSSDALERARRHASAPVKVDGHRGKAGSSPALAEDPGEVIDAYVRIASSLIPLREGVSTEALTLAARAARELLEGTGGAPTRSRSALERTTATAAPPDPPAVVLMRRRAGGGEDRTASYLLMSLACSSFSSPPPGAATTKEPLLTSPDRSRSGLMAFLSATCRNRADPARATAVLDQLLQSEPRFHEAHFFLGRLALSDRRLVSAEREFLSAADGLPVMTAAWAQLGDTRLLMEEYEWAAGDLGRALDIEPDQREALLAHARALNYAGRFEAALVPARRLLELGAWYVSDANYWLAFSELQLGRLPDADGHVREAKRTNPMNGDTARLTGLVAQRLGEFDRAQAEFELAVSRNMSDCESHLHLGMIQGQKERFGPSVDSFVRARDCYESMAASALSRRGEIASSSLSEARKEVARARLAQRIQGYRNAQAGASLGAAEGETQQGAYDKALARLAEAAADPSLSGRVAELEMRIKALRAPRER